MLRIICRSVDEGGAVNVGSPVDVTYKTFDCNLPDVEAYIMEHAGEQQWYLHRSVIGVEVVEETKGGGDE